MLLRHQDQPLEAPGGASPTNVPRPRPSGAAQPSAAPPPRPGSPAEAATALTVAGARRS